MNFVSLVRRVLPRLKLISSVRTGSSWEPEYLELAYTKTPEYEPINFRLRGYDFVILEKFQKELHILARTLGLDVSDCWAVPAIVHNIKRFKTNSTIVEGEYQLKLFERNVQVQDVQSPLLAILIDLVTTTCPPGVQLHVHYHNDDIENEKYVPDLELLELKDQLTQMGGPRKKPN